MHLIYSAKFGMSVVFNSSWDGCINTQEKWKTKTMQSFGGGQIRCIIGDVQVANAKTSTHLQIFVLQGLAGACICKYIVAVQKIH